MNGWRGKRRWGAERVWPLFVRMDEKVKSVRIHTSWRKFTITTLTIGVALVLVAGSSRSSDGLREPYLLNEARFQEIAAMVSEDREVKRIAPRWTRPETLEQLLGAERLGRYRQGLKEAGVKHGIEVLGTTRDIEFIVEVYGLSISGNARGIAYLHKPPYRNLTNDLQAVIDGDPAEGTYYEHITNNWYLFYDYRR